MEIKIKYFDDSIEKIEKIAIGDWIDLRARKDIAIPFMEFKLIPLNVAIELPKGYEAHIVPRSSTFKKWGIIQTNHCGIVDNSFCGDDDEWQMPAFSLKHEGSVIHKGDRVCQFRIVKSQEEITFKEVEILGNPNRGGIGSTNK